MTLDVGAVLGQTFGMVKQRFGPLLGLWVVYFVIQMVVSLLLIGGIGTSVAFGAGAMENPLAMGAGFVILLVLFYVFYILISFAQSASLTHQASALHSPPFGSSFSAGFKCSPTLLGLTIILIIAYFLAALVLGLLGALFSFAGDFGSAIFGLLVLVLAIYVSCRLAIVIPIIAVEEQRNPITAITRSWSLTQGNVLRILAVMLVFLLLVLVVIGIAFAMFGGTFMALAMPGATPGAGPEDVAGMLGMMGVFFLVFMVLIALMSMLWGSFMAALHEGLAGHEGVAETFA